MKIVVIQETVKMPNLTAAEVTEHWNQLKKLPNVELKIVIPDKYLMPEEYHDIIGDADSVLGLWVSDKVINEEWLSHHPNLKYIATLGHGWGEFDVEMTRRKKITITNTIYGAQTIAEYGWALLMEVCHHVNVHSDMIKKTDWTKLDERGMPLERAMYGNVVTPQIELYGKTCGIFGLGAIGLAFAKMASGFGMRVISYSRHKKVGAIYSFVEQVDFDTLLRESDVISIHAPYTAETADTFDKEAFSKMKDGAILINTARGGLIDETAMMEALNSGKLFAAGLDVLRDEPPVSDNPLFHTDKTSITGHIAWLTKESRLRAVDMAIENFIHYLNAIPTSVIN